MTRSPVSCYGICVLLMTALLLVSAVSAAAADSATPSPAPGAVKVNRTNVSVIANWDAVPFQEFRGPMKLGIVAFHESGVDVRFRVNNRTPVVVTKPAYNNETRVWEYWIPLNAKNFPDGPVTIRAVAYPNGNPASTETRVLPVLTLYANSKGTLSRIPVWADCRAGSDKTGNGTRINPFKSIERAYNAAGSGGTVYLRAGSCYSITNNLPQKNYRRWTTITAAPGLTRDKVRVRGGGASYGRFFESMVKWQNVEIFRNDPVTGGYATIMYFEPGSMVWFDHVEIYNVNGSHHAGVDTFNSQGARYFMTDSVIRNVTNAGGYWQRNCQIKNIGADVWRPSNGSFYVNINVDNMDYQPDAHPDLIQFYNPGQVVDNVIVYNVNATNMISQGLFGGPAQNVAFVNVMMEKMADHDGTNYFLSQIGEFNHLLIWHSTFKNLNLFLRNPPFTNCDIGNSIFSSLFADGNPSPGSLPGLTVRYNHYQSLIWTQTNGGFGTNYTLGNPRFISEAPVFGPYHAPTTYNYHLKSASPAYKKGKPLECVPADLEGRPLDPLHPSPGAFSESGLPIPG